MKTTTRVMMIIGATGSGVGVVREEGEKGAMKTMAMGVHQETGGVAPLLREKSQRRKVVEERMADKASKESNSTSVSARRVRNVRELIEMGKAAESSGSPGVATSRPKRSRKRFIPQEVDSGASVYGGADGGATRKGRMKAALGKSVLYPCAAEKSLGTSATEYNHNGESLRRSSGGAVASSAVKKVAADEEVLRPAVFVDGKSGRPGKRNVFKRSVEGNGAGKGPVEKGEAPEMSKKLVVPASKGDEGKGKGVAKQLEHGKEEKDEEEGEGENPEEDVVEDYSKLGKDYFEVESIKKKRVRKVR